MELSILTITFISSLLSLHTLWHAIFLHSSFCTDWVSIFVGKLWLLLKYCIYCVSTPSPYRESTNSLIMLPNIEGSIGNICCVVWAGCLILAISLPDWGPDYRHVYDPHLQNTWVPDCLPRLLLSIIPNEKKTKTTVWESKFENCSPW